MERNESLRHYIKGIPVVGTLARLANRGRILVTDVLVGQRAKNAFLRMKHTVLWYGLRNPQSEKRFAKSRPAVTKEQRQLVESLAKTGVAVANWKDVSIVPGELSRLEKRVGEFSQSAVDGINRARASYSDSLELGPLEHNRERFRRFFRDKNEAKLDDYILKMNPENTLLSSNDPLVTIGLSAPILHVVADYLKLWPKLIYTDVWYSVPMDPGRRVGSQQWHRDPEDKQMVKVYLYFSEVDESSGAMEYIPGTTNALAGRGLEIGRWKAAGAILYPSTETVEQIFPDAERFCCSGSIGTLLFCDTTGLHRGGVSRSGPRIVATWTFVTPASRYQRRFAVNVTEGCPFSSEARVALDL